MSLSVDIVALRDEARTLLAKVLVNPPTIKWRFIGADESGEVVGDKYLSIDGHAFEVVPVVGTRRSIGRTVEILKWKVLVSTSNCTPNDPLASPDIEELSADSFHEALHLVAALWLADQMSGHAQHA